MTNKQTYLFIVKNGKKVESITECVEPTALRQRIEVDETYRTAEQLSIYTVDADNLSLDLVYDSSNRLSPYSHKAINTLRDLYNSHAPTGQKEQLQKWLYTFGVKDDPDLKKLKWLKSLLSVQGYVLAAPDQVLQSCTRLHDLLNLELVPLGSGNQQAPFVPDPTLMDQPSCVVGKTQVYEKVIQLLSESTISYQNRTHPHFSKPTEFACVFNTEHGCYGVGVEVKLGDVHPYLIQSTDNGASWRYVDGLEDQEEVVGEYWFTVDEEGQPTLQFHVTVQAQTQD